MGGRANAQAHLGRQHGPGQPVLHLQVDDAVAEGTGGIPPLPAGCALTLGMHHSQWLPCCEGCQDVYSVTHKITLQARPTWLPLHPPHYHEQPAKPCVADQHLPWRRTLALPERRGQAVTSFRQMRGFRTHPGTAPAKLMEGVPGAFCGLSYGAGTQGGGVPGGAPVALREPALDAGFVEGVPAGQRLAGRHVARGLVAKERSEGPIALTPEQRRLATAPENPRQQPERSPGEDTTPTPPRPPRRRR